MATDPHSSVRERVHKWSLINGPSQHKTIIVTEGERQ
jgi:hypothetical protein